MLARTLSFLRLAVVVLAFALAPRPASAQDAQICFDAADKVTDGGKLEDAERRAAHEACQRALADLQRGTEISIAGGGFRRDRHPPQAIGGADKIEAADLAQAPRSAVSRVLAGGYFFTAGDESPALPSAVMDCFE